MLILFDLPYKNVHAFKTYSALYNQLKNVEKCPGKGKWIFARHSWQRMMSCYRYVRNRKLCGQLPETFEQGLEKALKRAAGESAGEGGGSQETDVFEIINGNPKKPVFIPLTPDVDVNALRLEWRQNYCKAHGYILHDVSSLADLKKIGGQDDHVAG